MWHRLAARRRSAGAAALVAAAVVAGCGGGGGSTTTSSTTSSAGESSNTASAAATTTSPGSTNSSTGGGEAASGHSVSDTLDAVLTSGDPDKACGTDYVTEQYLHAAYGGEQGCVKGQGAGSAAKSVDIKGFANGAAGEATAAVKIVPHGGVYDGEKVTVSLVKEDGSWKIDRLKSNAPVGP